MAFFKTSITDILAHKSNSENSFTKSANFSKVSSYFQTQGMKVDIQTALDSVYDTYKISKNPGDYVFVIARALTADVPNENHDAFPKEELLRFDTKFGCRVFQTFLNKPNHINHRSDDATQSRGLILDAHYNDINPDDQFVEILVAVDTTKDKKLAAGIKSGNINSMSMGCFQAGTPILLADGSTKNIEDITYGDKVITHTGSSKNVVGGLVRDHSNDIYEISIDSIQKPIVVTEEHPFWIFNPETKEFGWKEVKDLNVGDYATYPINSFSTGETFDIKKARLLGYYLAEGWQCLGESHVEATEKRLCGIGFTIHADEIDIRNEICSLIKDLVGRDPKVEQHRVTNKAINIVIYDTKLAIEFEKLVGHNSKQKKLSNEVMHWSLAVKAKMIGSYFNGDGHQGNGKYTKDKIYVSTASKYLAEQFRILLLELGINGYLRKHNRKPTPNGFSKTDNIQYQITIGKNDITKFIALTNFYGYPIEAKTKGTQKKFFYNNYWCTPITNIITKPYNEKVYNFEVEDDHSYIANGVAVHNCVAEICKCSICGHEASSTEELCPNHIRGGKKGKEFNVNGEKKKSFEHCYKVCFQEESWVDEPADPKALVSEVLGLQAQIKEAEKKNRMEDESTILELSTRLAKLESRLEDIKKESYDKEKFTHPSIDVIEVRNSEAFNRHKMAYNSLSSEQKKEIDTWIEETYPASWSYFMDKQALKVETKFNQTKVEDSTIKNIEQESETTSKFEDYKNKKEIEENRTMTSQEFGINPYAKKGSNINLKTPKWKDVAKGEGNPDALWKNVNKGKGVGTIPSQWKKALLDKVALDAKAKEYWTKYFKDGYGSELIKDIKRKKIGSAEKISLEQMKVLEPKFASIMKNAGFDSIKVSTIFKFSDLVTEDTEKVAEIKPYKDNSLKDKEIKDNIVVIDKDAPKDINSDKWTKLDAAIKDGDYSFEFVDKCWDVIEDKTGKKIASIYSNDSSDEFVEIFKTALITKGFKEVAETYGAWVDDEFFKTSLYPATVEPSLVDKKDDDLRPEVKKPTEGVEEAGSDDIANLYRGDIKEEDGVTEGGTKDMPMKASIDKTSNIDTIVADFEKEMRDSGASESEINKAVSILKHVHSIGESTPTEVISETNTEASIIAGVLEDGTRDLADASKIQPEQTKGLLADSADDIKDIDRATTVSDKIYDKGADDLAPKRDNIVTVGSKEFNEKVAEKVSEVVEKEIAVLSAAHASKFKRAMSLTIKRSDLNLINNEFKAHLHDVLTSEAELHDGDTYVGMDDSMATFIVENSFKDGAEKFVGSLIKEAEKVMGMSEDVLMAWEEELTNLNPLNPMLMTSSERVEDTSPMVQDAIMGNPIFKSSNVEPKNKFNGLSGLFGKATITASMKKYLGK